MVSSLILWIGSFVMTNFRLLESIRNIFNDRVGERNNLAMAVEYFANVIWLWVMIRLCEYSFSMFTEESLRS